MHIRTGLLAAAVFAICGGPARAQTTSRPATPTSGPAVPTPPPPPPLVTPVLPPPRIAPASQPSKPASTPASTPVESTPPPVVTPPPTPTPPTASDAQVGQLHKVVVNDYFDISRANIAPALGAVNYPIGPEQIQATPGGENASFQQVLLRAPGVVEDSFGQEHVRGEHANLTYRINGVLLPKPLNGFGQELDTRLIRSVSLITGSLPAQFGFHTAGIVDVTTKSGATLNHNELSIYGGGNDTFQPSVQVGGTDGKFDYFVTTSYTHNNLGIENPTSSHHALHDYTDQERLFGYFAYRIDDTSRFSVLANASNADFQIPNTAGLMPAFTLAGHPPGDSGLVNENQNEQLYYLVASYQKTIGEASFQVSGFSRYGQIRFSPDRINDLIYQGVAGRVLNSFVTNGVQFDSSYILNDQHTIRAGFIADYTSERLDTRTDVFPADMAGNATSDVPFGVTDNSNNHAWEAGLYLQDEWRITPKLTFNYGLRFDRFDANFDAEDQVSPRANLIYKLDDRTTIHGGYSRYFVPPPVQFVGLGTISKFVGTTNAPNQLVADAPKVERSNYYDLGVSRQIGKPLQVTLDGFYKQAKNLVDLGQFGAPVILAPFNYRQGTVYGAEIGANYKQGGLTAFGNFSWVQTIAHDINSQQFLIGSDELAFIRNHNIKLDHEAEFSASAGVSYAWKNDMAYIDFLYGSGLRAGFANTHQLEAHYPVNVGYEHTFRINGSDKNTVRLRFDIVNVFDESYQLRNGSGIGVGAAQFGARRTFLAGVTYAF